MLIEEIRSGWSVDGLAVSGTFSSELRAHRGGFSPVTLFFEDGSRMRRPYGHFIEDGRVVRSNPPDPASPE